MKHSMFNAVLLVCGLLVTFGATPAQPFLTTPQGARYQDLKPGSGAAAASGDVVTLHFVGWLDASGNRGKEIYNTRRQRGPVSFVVGTDKLMPGWSDGVIGMQAGGKRLLMLPPRLGYGARGVDDLVPANASLIFVIDLISVEKSPAP